MTNWWSHIWVFLCEECFDPIWLFFFHRRGPWRGIIWWSKVNWILMTEQNESWASAHFPASRASTVVAATWRRNSVARRPSRSEHQAPSHKTWWAPSTKTWWAKSALLPSVLQCQLWGCDRRTSKESLLVSYFQTGDNYAGGEKVTFVPDDGWRVKGNWQLSNENVIRRLITRNGSSVSVKRRR